MGKTSPLLVFGFDKPKMPKKEKVRTGETTGGHTQSGEQPFLQKEPTHRQKVKGIARDEKLHATRSWIAGHLSTKQHNDIHARANAALKGQISGFGKRGLGRKSGRGS